MPDCGQLYSIFASTYKLMDCISTEALRTVSFSETTLNCGLDPYYCCIFGVSYMQYKYSRISMARTHLDIDIPSGHLVPK